jgi:hypothetical protein
MECGGKGATLLRGGRMCRLRCQAHQRRSYELFAVYRGGIGERRSHTQSFHQASPAAKKVCINEGQWYRAGCRVVGHYSGPVALLGVGKERAGILKYCAIAGQWSPRKTLRRLVGRMRDHTGRSGTSACASTAACKNLASPTAARLTASALSVTTRLIRHFVLVVAEVLTKPVVA